MKGVDGIDASDDVLDLSLAQFDTIAALALTDSDAVTLSVSWAELDGLSDTQIQSYRGKGVDFLVLKDTGEALGALTAAQIASLSDRGVDRLDATDGRLTLSMEQYAALGALQLSETDVVTLSGTGAALSGLTVEGLTMLAAKGVHVLDASDDRLILSLEQYAALGSLTLTDSDTVTLSGTGSVLAGLSAAQISALAAKGIDVLDASDGRLTLNMEQYAALGTVQLSGTDVVTLSASGSALSALTAGELGIMAAKGVDVLDASDDRLTLSLEQYAALGSLTLTASDTVTLSGTGSALAGLSVAQISALGAKGVDLLDARTGDSYTLSLAQYGALGTVTLSRDDIVTILADRDAALTNGGTHLTLTGSAIRGTGNELSNTIRGTAKNNVLLGMDGDDILIGGAGKDTLAGGSGKDVFVFDTKPSKSKNLDKVSDFNSRDDAIWLDNAVFKKLGKKGSMESPAQLNKKYFVTGSKAKDKDDYLVYNKSKGVLYYDADGSGAGKAVEIAIISNKTKLSANDFFVI